MMMSKFIFLTSFIFSVTPLNSYAWASRGHLLICQAASYLLKDQVFEKNKIKNIHENPVGDFLATKQFDLAYLCNAPDVVWKMKDSAVAQSAAFLSSHYFDRENFLSSQKTQPLEQTDRSDLTAKMRSHPDWGSLFWRIEQFDQRAKNAASWKDFLLEISLLGHFIGDDSQPLHGTSDFDGWDTGHGGIHAYYEGSLIDELSASALTDVLREAKKIIRKNPKYLAKHLASHTGGDESFLRAERLSDESFAEIPVLLRLDQTLKSSVVGQDGVKQPAIRKPAKQMVGKFKNLLIRQLARAASLLARLIQDEYSANVNLQSLPLPKFEPLAIQVAPIEPDYLDQNPK